MTVKNTNKKLNIAISGVCRHIDISSINTKEGVKNVVKDI